MSEHRLNLSSLKFDLMQHCSDCPNQGNCIESKCLIGYSLMCIDYATNKGLTQISGGSKMIPEQDSKEYTSDFVADGLAQTCIACKNCMDNHSNDCVIAISRHCLEKAQLPRTIAYKGNVLTYLVDLSALDSRLAQQTKEAYLLKK